jgi:hypothetical protein
MDRAATGFVAVLRGLVTTTPTEVVFLMDRAATGLFVALLRGLMMVMDRAATGFVAVLRGLVTATPTEVVFLMDRAATGLVPIFVVVRLVIRKQQLLLL